MKRFESLTYKRRASWIKKVTQYMPLHEVSDAFDLEIDMADE